MPSAPPTQRLTIDQALQKALKLHEQNDLIAAERLYKAIINTQANHADALHLLGVIQHQFNRPEAALKLIDQALAIKPQYPAALSHKGLVLQRLMRTEEAIASYSLAINLSPSYIDALFNRGNAYKNLQFFDKACADYQQVLALDPNRDYCLGALMECKNTLCDWHDRPALAPLLEKVKAGQHTVLPFQLLALSEDPQTQLICSQAYTADKFTTKSSPLWQGESYQHPRIRIAYLSSDFYNHATAYLMAELFEIHDKNKFDVRAFSFSAGYKDDMHQRLSQAFSQFTDVFGMSDAAVAAMLREQEIDIVVDLKGFTQNCRTAIFSYRPAPIQVNYLGYPGTMGADFIDYIIADNHLIPPSDAPYYQEKVVRLPDSYQVNDSKRVIDPETPSRSEAQLPENAFVFCCFNNQYKITPPIFDIWMRLLHAVPGSVLWLLGDNDGAAVNLRREAQARGINPERLIFAPRTSASKHLARHALADLFLDTTPINAHTGASDALWAGLPLLTITGKSFAGRVAGSLLRALELPEMIADDLVDYERRALQLATDGIRLSALKAKITLHKKQSPLFNTARFCRHLEAAYVAMYQRHQQGLAPESIDVAVIESELISWS